MAKTNAERMKLVEGRVTDKAKAIYRDILAAVHAHCIVEPYAYAQSEDAEEEESISEAGEVSITMVWIHKFVDIVINPQGGILVVSKDAFRVATAEDIATNKPAALDAICNLLM